MTAIQYVPQHFRVHSGVGQTWDSEGHLVATDTVNLVRHGTYVTRPGAIIPGWRARHRRLRGLGQTDPALTDPTDLGWTTTSVPSYTGVTASAGAGIPASTTTNWTNILSNLINVAGKTTQVALSPLSALPAGSYYSQTPYGTIVSTGGAATSSAITSNLLNSLTSSLSGIMPILLIGGGVLVVMMMAKK